MYPFSIFADYRHFADSERKNREKGREMPWHFRIDVRLKKWSALRAEISQIIPNQTNKKDKYFTSLFNEHEICRRPTDRREVIDRMNRIVKSSTT